MRQIAAAAALVVTLIGGPVYVYSHCQVPCGIYDDHMRVVQMQEDVATCEKAITEISALTQDDMTPKDFNQVVRWVNNKEIHAEKIIGTIANYFLTQRVKTDATDYSTRLAAHHAVMIAAMKVKQDANLSTTTVLKAAIAKLEKYYPEHTH